MNQNIRFEAIVTEYPIDNKYDLQCIHDVEYNDVYKKILAELFIKRII